MVLLLRRLAIALGVVTPLVACSATGDEDTGESADAIGSALGCPTVLVAHNLAAARGPSLWNVDEQDCFAIGKSTFPAPVSLELYLGKSPHSSLGLKPGAVATCFNKYLRDDNAAAQRFFALPSAKQDYVERATISDYYFVMNTFRQATRGTLEAIAALDFVLGWTPALAAQPRDENDRVYAARYAEPLAVDSVAWSRELRACGVPEASPMDIVLRETREHLTMITYLTLMKRRIDRDVATLARARAAGRAAPAVWYKSWAPEAAASPDARIASFQRDAKDLAAQIRGHEGAAPWLSGKHMKALLDADTLMRSVNAWRPYTDDMPPEELARLVGRTVDTRMFKPSATPIVNDLRKQLRANRKLLSDKLGEVYDAAACMHGPPSSSCMRKVNAVMEVWPPFDGRAFTGDFLPEDDEVLERLDASDSPRAKDLARQMRDQRSRANASVAGMFAAECRSGVRRANDQIDDLKKTLAQSIAITIATAGLGSWLSASKAALAAASGARAAQLAQRVVALNALLLGTDVFWVGEAVVSSMRSCDQYINKNLTNAAVSPLGHKAPYCRRGETALGGNDIDPALAPTAVADYRSCAFDASLNVALNTLGLVPSAVGMRNAIRGPK